MAEPLEYFFIREGAESRGLIWRHFKQKDKQSEAVYSPCEKYRYWLRRVWKPALPCLGYVLLNPSTATEMQNDPTVERCERRARHLGYGSFQLVNIFAWRDVSPKALYAAQDPIGIENDWAIGHIASGAEKIIAAWGAHGALLDRGRAVHAQLISMQCSIYHLGLTQKGEPRHPLYISYEISLRPWIKTV